MRNGAMSKPAKPFLGAVSKTDRPSVTLLEGIGALLWRHNPTVYAVYSR